MSILTTTNKVLSVLIVVLFCWVIFPIKWVRSIVFKARKSAAIKEADELCRQTHKAAYVVQMGTRFAVGNRAEFRDWNKKAQRGRKRYLDIDYRHAVVYKATPQ